MIFYRKDALILFNDYLQGVIVSGEFIQKLRTVKAMHKHTIDGNTQENSMWFKFSEDDTLGTTTNDLERDLFDTNRDFTLERMREAINLEMELFIYFS